MEPYMRRRMGLNSDVLHLIAIASTIGTMASNLERNQGTWLIYIYIYMVPPQKNTLIEIVLT